MSIQLISNKMPQSKTFNNDKNKKKQMNKTLEGVLINNHVKDTNYNDANFEKICDTLFISNNIEKTTDNPIDKKETSFDMKKALLPVFLSAGVASGGALGLSMVMKKASKTLFNAKTFEQLPDLALNMNIRQEPQFAVYRMLRDPSFKNIMAGVAVFVFSGLTIVAKNTVDALKEIWVKKQSADIERDLQEKLIEVETNSFSGKLKVINNLLVNTTNYFKKSFNIEESSKNQQSFGASEESKKNENKDKSKSAMYKLGAAFSLVALAVAGKVTFSSIRKTVKEANDFANGYTQKVIDAIEKMVSSKEKPSVEKLSELFESISAKPEYIKDTLKKINVSDDEISKVIENTEKVKKTIFADAPTALGGIPKKIQYYCYLDEDRGHLYNWLLNPENKFTKYLFLSFTAVSCVGYLFNQAMDAMKQVAVIKENAKTEYGLKKKLVDVEVENFKSKKQSAIDLLIQNFEYQKAKGKSKEELMQLAENILVEIKNGPPYVYT
ncbi:MAG: hypothetical protein MJ229_05365 [bacterium]|nr:hypothetical protein [bacterium]